MSSLSHPKYQRQRIVKYARKHSVTETAIRYKVSRKTVYKWLSRYDGTTASLEDRSHRPKTSPKSHTELELRQIRRRLKKYKWTDLILASGYIVIDFDHVPAPSNLVIKLAGDDNFETILAFRSPSGDGVKWIVSTPCVPKPDGTPFTHGECFTILSNYTSRYYGIKADPSGRDIRRACFLPYDPEAFLNPFYIEDDFDYDITRFLHATA